jgi:hypothetical protein
MWKHRTTTSWRHCCHGTHARSTRRQCPPSGMYPCVSRRKSDMDSNRTKNCGHQEEWQPASERKAAVQRRVWRVHRGLHDLTAVLCQRGDRPLLLQFSPSRYSVNKDDESRNLQTKPTKEPRNLQHPRPQSATPNCGRSLKFPTRNSSLHWGQLKWKLTMETMQTTPPNVSNIRRHAARQVVRLPLH